MRGLSGPMFSNKSGGPGLCRELPLTIPAAEKDVDAALDAARDEDKLVACSVRNAEPEGVTVSETEDSPSVATA